MQFQKLRIYLLLFAIVVLLLVFSFKLASKMPKNQSKVAVENIPTQVTPTPTIGPTSTEYRLIEDNGFRIMAVETNKSYFFDIYIVENYISNMNNVVGKFVTIKDFDYRYAYPAEFRNGKLFLSKNGELWVYDRKGDDGTKLSGRYRAFSASYDGELVAINDNVNLTVTDSVGNVKKSFPISEFVKREGYNDVQAIEWTKNSGSLWLLIWEDGKNKFIRINVADWSSTSYKATNFPSGIEYEYNPTNSKYLASDYPAFLEEDSFNEFKASGKTVNLYLYDVESDTRQLVSQSKVQRFEPHWLNDNYFEYTDPISGKRIIKSIADFK